MAYSDDVQQAENDPRLAKQLIAGVSGTTVELSIIQRDPDSQIAQVIQAQLARPGSRWKVT